MKRYQEYKDSGVEWIGEIPMHWKVAPFKRKININNGKDYKDFLDAEIYPVMGSGGCFAYCSQYMYDGEALLLGRKGTIDKPIYINEKFWVVDTMFYAIPHKDLCCKFAYYMALTFPFNLYSTATALPSMTQTDLANNPVAFPPFHEQQAIVRYLDTECGKIDKMIAIQTHRIELLQELKQSVITEAVTKGLNPNVEFKDSSVEWIGEIPRHWIIKRMKFLTKDYKAGPFGSSLITSNLLPKGNILIYTPEHIASKDVNLLNNLYLPETRLEEMSQFLVKSNDVIFPIVGTLGRAMLITDNMPKGIINQRLAKFSVNTNEILIKYFLWLFANSSFFETYINLYQRGSIIVNLTKNIVGSMPVPLPSIREQQAIADYLDVKCKEIDIQISKSNRRIELLQELKQSIITEAVTGKIMLPIVTSKR